MEGQKRVQKTVNIQWEELLTIILVLSIFENNCYCYRHLYLEIMRQILKALPVMTQDVKLLVNICGPGGGLHI